MYLQAVNPRRRQTLYVFQPADGIAHRANRHLLLVLVLNVFAVGRLEGFFPILPTGVRKPGMSADNLGGRLLVRLCTKTPSRVSAPEAASLRGSACDPPFGSEPVVAHGLQTKPGSSLPYRGGA